MPRHGKSKAKAMGYSISFEQGPPIPQVLATTPDMLQHECSLSSFRSKRRSNEDPEKKVNRWPSSIDPAMQAGSRSEDLSIQAWKQMRSGDEKLTKAERKRRNAADITKSVHWQQGRSILENLDAIKARKSLGQDRRTLPANSIRTRTMILKECNRLAAHGLHLDFEEAVAEDLELNVWEFLRQVKENCKLKRSTKRLWEDLREWCRTRAEEERVQGREYSTGDTEYEDALHAWWKCWRIGAPILPSFAAKIVIVSRTIESGHETKPISTTSKIARAHLAPVEDDPPTDPCFESFHGIPSHMLEAHDCDYGMSADLLGKLSSLGRWHANQDNCASAMQLHNEAFSAEIASSSSRTTFVNDLVSSQDQLYVQSTPSSSLNIGPSDDGTLEPKSSVEPASSQDVIPDSEPSSSSELSESCVPLGAILRERVAYPSELSRPRVPKTLTQSQVDVLFQRDAEKHVTAQAKSTDEPPRKEKKYFVPKILPSTPEPNRHRRTLANESSQAVIDTTPLPGPQTPPRSSEEAMCAVHGGASCKRLDCLLSQDVADAVQHFHMVNNAALILGEDGLSTSPDTASIAGRGFGGLSVCSRSSTDLHRGSEQDYMHDVKSTERRNRTSSVPDSECGFVRRRADTAADDSAIDCTSPKIGGDYPQSSPKFGGYHQADSPELDNAYRAASLEFDAKDQSASFGIGNDNRSASFAIGDDQQSACAENGSDYRPTTEERGLKYRLLSRETGGDDRSASPKLSDGPSRPRAMLKCCYQFYDDPGHDSFDKQILSLPGSITCEPIPPKTVSRKRSAVSAECQAEEPVAKRLGHIALERRDTRAKAVGADALAFMVKHVTDCIELQKTATQRTEDALAALTRIFPVVKQ